MTKGQSKAYWEEYIQIWKHAVSLQQSQMSFSPSEEKVQYVASS